MNRREFITLVGSSAVAWPLSVRAQVRRPLVGYLAGAASSSVVGSTSKLGFINGLREHGYVDGRDIDIAYKFADARSWAKSVDMAELRNADPHL